MEVRTLPGVAEPAVAEAPGEQGANRRAGAPSVPVRGQVSRVRGGVHVQGGKVCVGRWWLRCKACTSPPWWTCKDPTRPLPRSESVPQHDQQFRPWFTCVIASISAISQRGISCEPPAIFLSHSETMNL